MSKIEKVRPSYRPEIDGLRAVAVIAVILYHADFALFKGGYVGVDVFFVISGFLITGIILKDLESGRFSLRHFYERRVRRIFPALFLVMALCLPFAWFWMLPDPLENFGQSLVATTFFANNILLTMTSGYWDLASEFKPLLHTWSLAVEEQFYVVFPLLLMGFWTFSGFRSWLVIGALAVASFAFFLWLQPHQPDAVFYLLLTRAWELLIGALAAFWSARREAMSNEAIAIGSLLVIVGSVFALDHELPSANLILASPVLATALLLIFGGKGTRTGAWLAHPLPVGIGLISYSLYLFHQPILAFLRINSFDPPGIGATLGAITLAVFLAWASWRFVETPFRDSSRIGQRTLVVSTCLAMVSASAIGGVLHHHRGFPERFFAGASVADVGGLYIGYNMAVHDLRADTFPPGDGRRILVLGNSQARDLVNMIRETSQFEGDPLVYRDDIGLCRERHDGGVKAKLLGEADLIIATIERIWPDCVAWLQAEGFFADRRLLMVGPKQFGYNLNRFVRLPPEERLTARASVLEETVAANQANRSLVPEGYYLDILANLSSDGTSVPVFDEMGRLVSADRVHLTQSGARLVGAKVFRDPVWQAFDP